AGRSGKFAGDRAGGAAVALQPGAGNRAQPRRVDQPERRDRAEPQAGQPDSAAAGQRTGVVEMRAPALVVLMVAMVVSLGAGSGDTDNGVALQLTSAAPTQEQCLAFAPALGQTVLAILKGE